MPIATYNDLLDKIPKWAERVDVEPDLIKDFIYMAESDCSQLLRVPAMEDDALLTVADGRVTVPFDFMELRRLTHQEEDKVLTYVPWDQFVELNIQGGVFQDTQTPTYFSRQGAQWFISPAPADDTEILCHYYRFIPALSDDIQTNWLIQLSPQAYLFGALRYLFEYVMDNERAAYWENKFNAELTKLQSIADRAEHRGSVLSVRSL